MDNIIERLLNSDEPSVRYKILVNVLGERRDSSKIRKLQEEIRVSERVQALLSGRDSEGRIPHFPYRKFFGAHWVLASLADIGYPPHDASLIPLREQVYNLWLSPEHTRERVCDSAPPSNKDRGVPIIQGRARRCASQEGNALYATLALGLADERVNQLARNLMKWQWPDGGWNCDRKPEACYWHYDILVALKVMAEAGFIQDPRCQDALDLLQSRRLSDGGWPAEERFYRLSKKLTSGCDLVSWGGVSKKRMNEFVTVDALYVLKKSGRLK